MRVGMYYNNNDVRLEEMDVPETGPGELLVRIEASGICGSDVMEWYRIKKAPLVLGHEVAGVVAEVGKGVNRFRVGDRVVVTHHVPCNTCRHCLKGNYSVCDTLRTTNFVPGGFAEYVNVPQLNVDRGTFHLPDTLSFEDGTFVEPLACVLRGLRVSGFQPGQNVMVIGSGISGLLHIQAAKAMGAGTICAVDISDSRLGIATALGADIALKAGGDLPQRFREKSGGILADLVAVCAGAEAAILDGIRSVERGGTLLIFAPLMPDRTIALPVWDMWREGIKITTSYAGPPQELLQAIELLAAGRIETGKMVTHRLGLGEIARGFELVGKGGKSIKVIIEPQK